MSVSVGSIVGTFQIVRLLGRGGMGEVYLAHDSRLDRDVALKVVGRSSPVTGSADTALLEEAKKAAKISSPYVVSIWEVSTASPVAYIAMEYIPGADLRSMLPVGSIDTAIELARKIGEGIRAAHKQGVVHRDLKPENIKMDDSGNPKILDFGLARTVDTDSIDAQGNIEGTLYYLSPEQLSGQPQGPRSDLFSYGCIVYELLTGTRPFEGAFPASIVYSILHEDPIPASDRRDELPGWVDEFLAKLLAKNQNDRFADMESALAYLTAAEAGSYVRIPAAGNKRKQRVTVIDLRNLSGDSNWDYFCMGFSEDVIRELTRRTELVVCAEPATAEQRDIREVFKRCHSDFVVTGSLLKWQDKIKLNLAVYGEGGDRMISAENYAGDSSDLFDLLSKAAEDASTALATATGASTIAVAEPIKGDVSSYDFYLKAKSYYQTNKPEDLQHAIKLYQKSLEIDPNFPLSHAGLSDVYTFQYMAYYDRTEERIESARRSAQQALALSPTLPEGHRSLGRYYQFTGNLAEAERCFLKAIEYNPKYAIAFRTLGWLKRSAGVYDQAMTFSRRALELAPTDLETLLLVSLISMDQRQYTPAMATLQRAIELGPDYGRAYYTLGSVYLKLGVFELALENFLLAGKYQGDPNCYTDAGYLYLAMGRLEEARAKLNESIQLGCLPFVAHYFLAWTERLDKNDRKSQDHFAEVRRLTTGKDADPLTGDIHTVGFHLLSLAALGDRERAEKLIADLKPRIQEQGEVMLSVARAYMLLNDTARAREVLHKAFTTHAGPTEREISIDPHFRDLSD